MISPRPSPIRGSRKACRRSRAGSEHQAEKLTHEQMIELVGRYDTESKAAYEHAENTRIAAYRTRDIIRMTCIDDKLTQMKDVINVATPRLLAFPAWRRTSSRCGSISWCCSWRATA